MGEVVSSWRPCPLHRLLPLDSGVGLDKSQSSRPSFTFGSGAKGANNIQVCAISPWWHRGNHWRDRQGAIANRRVARISPSSVEAAGKCHLLSRDSNTTPALQQLGRINRNLAKIVCRAKIHKRARSSYLDLSTAQPRGPRKPPHRIAANRRPPVQHRRSAARGQRALSRTCPTTSCFHGLPTLGVVFHALVTSRVHWLPPSAGALPCPPAPRNI